MGLLMGGLMGIYIYIYIYVCIYICMYMCIYMYVYVYVFWPDISIMICMFSTFLHHCNKKEILPSSLASRMRPPC